jgi:phospholipid/cholesterol/gamma-HCH transport system substrate-binding protein
METRSHYVAVGAFVLVMVAALFATTLWLAGTQFREHYTRYVTYLTGTVTGLGKNALVRLNGIEIGKVEDIAFDPNDPKQVVVTLDVRDGIVLHTDSIASLASSGLTGQSYILINGGRTGSPVLVAKEGQIYPVIPSRPSTLQQVEATVPQMLARFSAIADHLDQLLTPDNQQAISDTLAHLAAVTGTLAAHRDQVGRIIDNTSAATQSLDVTIQNLDKTLATVQAMLAASRDIPGRIDSTLDSVHEASQNVKGLSTDADQLVRENRADIRSFSAGGLAQMTKLVAQLQVLTQSLTRVSTMLERDPSSLLYGDRRQGYAPQ